MLRILDNKHWTKLAKDLGHQFMLLAKKVEDSYQILSNLVKSTWKATGMAKNIMSNLFAKLRPHITANKGKSEHHTSTFKAIDKYWGRAYYKRFYQIDKIIELNKFFCHIGTIVRQYQSPCRIIAIWAINNFIAYRILNTYVGVSFDSYKH